MSKKNIVFELGAKQDEKYLQFFHEHSSFDEDNEHYAGCAGGNISITFTPTSIMCIVKVKCSICGKELDLTDGDDW